MAKIEPVPLEELRATIPAKLLPMVEQFKKDLEKHQSGRATPDKGEDVKDIRRALRIAASSLNKKIRFPRRGEEDAVSYYLLKQAGRPQRKRGAGKKGRARKTAG